MRKFIWNVVKSVAVGIYLAAVCSIFIGAFRYVNGETMAGLTTIYLATAIAVGEVQLAIGGLHRDAHIEVVFFSVMVAIIGTIVVVVATFYGWLLQLAGHVGASITFALLGLTAGAIVRWGLFRIDPNFNS